MLVTGAAGMLGSALVPELLRAGHELALSDINLTDLRPWGPGGPQLAALDVRSHYEVEDAVDQVRPDVVLHLAAMTDLEKCEADRGGAYLTNTVGTKFVAIACQRRGIPMVYISTAGVFDGAKVEPYNEFDAANPLNAYGASKYEGEKLVEQLLDRFYILRAGWMVGGGCAKDHKFVARILQQLRDGRTTIYAVGDKFGTPTYAPDFAKCFNRLLISGLYGRYHMACGGSGTRYDVAAEILRILGRDDVELIEVGSEFFAEEFSATRPRSEIMENWVLELQGMNSMRPWPIALEEYLRTEFGSMMRPAASPAAALAQA